MIKEHNQNGDLIGQHLLTNISMQDVINQKMLVLNRNFHDQSIYTLNITFRNSHYIQNIESRLMLAQLNVQSSKMTNLVTNTDILDSLYPVIITEVSSTGESDVFTYHWNLLGEHSTTNVNKLTKLFPKANTSTCYDVRLNVSSENSITAQTETTICLEMGVNVTLDFTNGIMLGDPTSFTLNLYDMGSDSCLILELTNLSKIVIFSKEGQSPNSCQERGYITGGKQVISQNFDQQADGFLISIYEELFLSEGIYEIMLIAANNVTLQMEKFAIDVINQTCRSPNVDIIGKVLLG